MLSVQKSVSATMANAKPSRNPIQWFQGPDMVLSNNYICRIYIFGKWFKSVTQAYFWKRAEHANDFARQSLIMQAESPIQAHILGMSIDFDPAWGLIRESMMFDILMAKVRYCPEYERIMLLSPANVEFRSKSSDKLWGGLRGCKNKLGNLHKLVQKCSTTVYSQETTYVRDFKNRHSTLSALERFMGLQVNDLPHDYSSTDSVWPQYRANWTPDLIFPLIHITLLIFVLFYVVYISVVIIF